ncbi:hypothetical protein L596_022841 [Steinernema carpocapsae]|uniref:DUF7636 domain-containing protein n=1 Tax=Steinernema carpocapsae TaxID=34508 RepID=A0A4U5MNN0_STECR|nr:hypothetical protein L596_022841 [Steinernema carpocapsae]
MKFWASREFEELKSVHFTPLNLKMSIDGRDLKLLHKAAKMTYNELIFSNSCDPFPQASKVTVALKNRIYEKDAFTIDIPKKRDVLTPELEQIIKAKTQVTHIKLRPKWAWKEYERLVVSAIGSLEALAKLENLLIGDIPMRSFENHSFCDKQLPKIILEKILKDDDDKEDEDGDEEFY